jgi:hypothetical protein
MGVDVVADGLAPPPAPMPRLTREQKREAAVVAAADEAAW